MSFVKEEHTTQSTVVPDGKKPNFLKRLFKLGDRIKDSASSPLATRSVEDLAVTDRKSFIKRLSGALIKSTKTGSTLTSRSVEDLASDYTFISFHIISESHLVFTQTPGHLRLTLS
ncbi:hypothetical protein H0H92_015147, partial [Tricholoma furcatifolium]